MKNDKACDFQFIIDNQTELFNHDNIIIPWTVLKKKIEKNEELSYRYKTFEGLTWDKEKELKDDTMFIHINISALTCMNRISNIMNKFCMPEDFVRITLK